MAKSKEEKRAKRREALRRKQDYRDRVAEASLFPRIDLDPVMLH